MKSFVVMIIMVFLVVGGIYMLGKKEYVAPIETIKLVEENKNTEVVIDKKPETIKIGSILPLSGDSIVYGEAARSIIQLIEMENSNYGVQCCF